MKTFDPAGGGERHERGNIVVVGSANMDLVAHPARFPAPDDLYAQVDFLIVNETEAQVLTAITVSDPATTRQTADALRTNGARTVIVTPGAGGDWYAGPEGEGHMAAPRVDAVDTTAAGDTFAGGFAAARVRGALLNEAITFAQRAAALTVMRKGAQTSIPARAEVDAQFPPPDIASARLDASQPKA